MQGVFPRFPTKKALKEAVARERPEKAEPFTVGAVLESKACTGKAEVCREDISLEATSIFGDEYGGPLSDAPMGTYTVVGPDPHTSRKWYANIIVQRDNVIVR